MKVVCRGCFYITHPFTKVKGKEMNSIKKREEVEKLDSTRGRGM